MSEDGTVTEWCDVDGVDANNGSNHSKAIERVKNRDYDGSLYMVNKPPRWNDQVFFQTIRAVGCFKGAM